MSVRDPAREPLETLLNLRKTMSEYNFSSQYQQRPAPLAGNMVRREWFRSYGDAQTPDRFDSVVQSWDTANKATELSDYSVCVTLGVKEQKIYVLNVLRRRVNYPDLKRAVRAQMEAFCATAVLIEEKASGIRLVQEPRQEGLYLVEGVEPTRDKVMRLHSECAAIENGFVYLPREAHWLEDYVKELISFPQDKHDDQVDATSQGLQWIRQAPYRVFTSERFPI